MALVLRELNTYQAVSNIYIYIYIYISQAVKKNSSSAGQIVILSNITEHKTTKNKTRNYK